MYSSKMYILDYQANLFMLICQNTINNDEWKCCWKVKDVMQMFLQDDKVLLSFSL